MLQMLLLIQANSAFLLAHDFPQESLVCYTRSLQVQGFCLLFAVSLALIIAQIGENVLCRNAFWVATQDIKVRSLVPL